MLRKRVSTILYIVLLVFPITLSANWKAEAWDIFKGTVSATAGNVLSSFITPASAEKNAEQLNAKVEDLEEKLKEFDVDGERPDNFFEVKQTIMGLRVIVSSIDKRVTTLEDKVKSLEQRLLATSSSIPVVSEAISIEDKKRILRLVKPSFKCSKAKKDIELSICQSLVLRDIDGRMGKIYWELRDYFPENISKQLRSEQLKWLRKRDATCNAYDENCLVTMYEERINELRAKF